MSAQQDPSAPAGERASARGEASGRPLWVSAGEVSGDMHGGLLVQAMKKRDPGLVFTGMGGKAMQAAGVDTRFRMEQLSVMGISEVFGHLPKILRLLADIRAELQRLRPRAVIVIDAPDFHFRVIKAARSLDIPVYYYISPKIWAWRQGRAEFIRANVRKLISILPFEVDFYRQFAMEVEYVGNPLVDIVDFQALSSIQPVEGRIGILPGSRKKEVASLMPEFGGAARILLDRLPHLSFVCMRAPTMDEGYLRSFWPAELPLTVLPAENRWQEMRRCEMLFAASGTVTLESSIAGVPTIAAYKVSALTEFVGKHLIKAPYMSLTNLILGREALPECIQREAEAGVLAEKALAWLAPEGSAPEGGTAGKNGLESVGPQRGSAKWGSVKENTFLRGITRKAGDTGNRAKGGTANYRTPERDGDQGGDTDRKNTALAAARKDLDELREKLGAPGAADRAAAALLADMACLE